MRNIIYLGIFMITIGCSTNRTISFYQEDSDVNLFAFVGKKISITEFNPNDPPTYDTITSTKGKKSLGQILIMDKAFRAKYAITRKVFNDLKRDTVEFVVYDHYGRPAFEKYKNVIIYISKNEDGNSFFHQKYQFDVFSKESEIESLFNARKEKQLKELFQN